MKTHNLKTWPEYYQKVLDGTKTFELRKDDRGFKVGDELCLHEWEKGVGYTGPTVTKKIAYILRAADYAPDDEVLKPDYCILGFAPEPVQSKGAVKCHLVSVDFEPTKANGSPYYGTEIVLKNSSPGHSWRSGNYLVIPVDITYELEGKNHA